jgi:transposase
MGFNFRGGDRDQLFLMPPSVREWLPADHLAWFVLDVVGEFDLAEFRARYRPDGRGGAAYEPAAMVALLVYAYCVGDRSSRRIERRCVEDVAYRVIVANATPDHATIARFRAEHEDALAGLFGQVLAMCAAAGLVQVGLVALDGTKLEAAAAKAANMTAERLERALADEALRIIEEAKAIDAAEDERYGAARGDELPAELADRSERLRRLREAKARLDAEQAKASSSRRRRDQPLRVNVTDPESGLMKTPGGFCQGYNAQAAATADQVIIAAEVSNRGVDVEQFQPMVLAASANLTAAGVGEPIGTIVADAGYYSADNASFETASDVLIATRNSHKLPDRPPEPLHDSRAAFDHQERARAVRFAEIFERVTNGEITMKDAAVETGLSVPRTYEFRDRWRRAGVEGLIRKRLPNGQGLPPALRAEQITRHEMERRLTSGPGRALYKQRGQIIEPIFGQIKDPRGIRRFQRRGLTACASEWKLITATHNILKLWRNTNPSAPPALA